LLRVWRARDDLFDRVEPTWWGAEISDPRYPELQESNYARVEATEPVDLAEVDAALVRIVDRSACRRPEVVVFFPEEQARLLAEASTRGERLHWDLVLEHRGGGPAPADDPTEEVEVFDEGFWRDHRESTRGFDIEADEVLDQLEVMERELMIPAGRRWFVVRSPDGTAGAFAALLVREGVAFVDHVVTLPRARRRGFATALTRRILAEVEAVGVEHTYLNAEPDGVAARMYVGLGFRKVGHLASWTFGLGDGGRG